VASATTRETFVPVSLSGLLLLLLSLGLIIPWSEGGKTVGGLLLLTGLITNLPACCWDLLL
jgi:hypothetical protein